MAAETITVASTSQLIHFALSPDGELTDHIVVAFRVTGDKAVPVYWPELPKGARLLVERVGEGYCFDGMKARTAVELASMIRSRTQ